MHLHTVIVSYKRPTLTERTLRSYLETVSVPHSLIIVDNGSPADVTDLLLSLDVDVLLLKENRYPGYATNRGWERMPPETTLLQRSDNDTLYLAGWCEEMVEAFANPAVGQFGPVGVGHEPWTAMPCWPVGGNSIIRRDLYDAGLRYSEKPWGTARYAEDHQMTLDVWDLGYTRVFGTRVGIEHLPGDGDAEYEAEVLRVRGLG